jgi:hypothetical protein
MVDYSTVAQGGDTRLGVRTVGSLVKIHAFPIQEVYPTEYTIAADTAIAEDDETADLSADVDCWIEKGTYLYFEGTKVIVAAESKLVETTGTIIAIQPAAAAVDLGDEALTYGLITLPTTSIANGEEVGKVDAKTHAYGEQGAQERVSRTFNATCQLNVSPGDRGYFYHALPAALNKAGYNGTVNAAIAVPASNGVGGYEFTFGTALVTIDGDDLPLDEIRRPSLMLDFQSPWLKTTLYDAESTAVKTAITDSCKLAGFPLPV